MPRDWTRIHLDPFKAVRTIKPETLRELATAVRRALDESESYGQFRQRIDPIIDRARQDGGDA